MENPIPAEGRLSSVQSVSEPEKTIPAKDRPSSPEPGKPVSAELDNSLLENPVLGFPFHNPAWLPENQLFPASQFSSNY